MRRGCALMSERLWSSHDPLIDRSFGMETEWGLAIEVERAELSGPWVQIVDRERALILPEVGRVTEIFNQRLPASILRLGTMLDTGGRVYEDHCHPETATPECQTGEQLLLAWDEHEEIVTQTLDTAVAEGDILGYVLNNRAMDGKGKTWGPHESYQTRRSLLDINRIRGAHGHKFYQLGLFLATRGIFVGAGGVIHEKTKDDQMARFVIAQKMPYLERDVSLDTTHNKPLLNTRDEPHANPIEFCRLHITCVDTNMSPQARWLAVGMTRIVLTALEADLPLGRNVEFSERLFQIGHKVARDPTCAQPLTMKNGTTITGLEIQGLFIEQGFKLKAMGLLSEELETVLEFWAAEHGKAVVDPMNMSPWSDWPARLKVLEQYRAKKGLP